MSVAGAVTTGVCICLLGWMLYAHGTIPYPAESVCTRTGTTGSIMETPVWNCIDDCCDGKTDFPDHYPRIFEFMGKYCSDSGDDEYKCTSHIYDAKACTNDDALAKAESSLPTTIKCFQWQGWTYSEYPKCDRFSGMECPGDVRGFVLPLGVLFLVCVAAFGYWSQTLYRELCGVYDEYTARKMANSAQIAPANAVLVGKS